MILLFFESPSLLPWSVARAKVDKKPGLKACSGALSLATLMTGTPSLSDTTIAWSPSTLGNFLYRNRFRSSAMMNPFLPQDQSPRLAFWVAWFSELPLQGQLLGQVLLLPSCTDEIPHVTLT